MAHVLPRTCWPSRSSWRSDDPAYEDIARKFFEHFVYIADAMNDLRRRHRAVGRGGRLLLRRAPPADGDAAPAARCARWSGSSRSSPSRRSSRRSSTGCPASSGACSGSSRTAPSSRGHVDHRASAPGGGVRRLLSIVRATAARRACSRYMLDERRVPLALRHPRALARTTASIPTCCTVDGVEHRVDYEPAESTTGLFGGNSNWRGPDLVPGELPADRVAAEVPPLLRRRLQGRVPDRLRPRAEPLGGRRRAVARA